MPATMSPLDLFHRQILPFLTAESVYRHVRFSGVKGRFLRGQCPFGGDTDDASSFWVDMHTLRWSCLAHCGCGGRSPLAFLNGGDFPRPGGGDFPQPGFSQPGFSQPGGAGELAAVMARAVELAPACECAIPEWAVEDQRQAARAERVESLLETFFLLTHAMLLDAVEQPESKNLCAALRALGFRTGDLAQLPLGLVADGDVLREGLRESGFSEAEIDASELVADARLAGRIVGPIRTADRRLASFWALAPDGRLPEFLYKGKWKDTIGFFGFDVALSRRRRPDSPNACLFVVDRIPDAVLFHSLGVHNSVATGGPWRRVSRKRWQLLQHESPTQITLVLDDVGPPDAATIDDLAALYDAMSPRAVDVLPKASLGELGLLHGFADSGRTGQVASVLAAEAVHALAYCAARILDLYRPKAGWTDASRHRAWKHAIELYAGLAAKHADALQRHFVPEIIEGLGRRWDDFQPIADEEPEIHKPPTPDPSIPNPPTAESAAASPPMVEARPTAKSTPRPARRPAATNGECPLHACDKTDCFCFD